MTKEIQETIEEVEKKITNFTRAQEYYAAKNEIPPTSTLKGKLFFVNILKILQAHEQAEGELEEKDVGGECSDPLRCNICEFKKGSDEMRSIARPILAKAMLRVDEADKMLKMKQDDWMEVCKENDELQKKIEELEEIIKTGKCKHIAEDVLSAECSLCHLAWCEGRIKVLEKKIEGLEEEKYFGEFKIIDGLNQHPKGLTFEQWKKK